MTEQYPYAAGPQTPKSQCCTDDDPPSSFREQENPIRSASLFSMVSMAWMQPLISLGAKRPLEREDVWAMCPEDTCEVLRVQFEKELDTINNRETPPPLGIPRVALALVRTFPRQIAVVFASDLLFLAGSALMSFLVEAILDYINDRDNVFGIQNGYVLVVMLSLVAFISMMSFNFAWFISSRVGVSMRSLLLDAVYRKSLRLSSEARQKYSSGEIMTLISVDIDRVFNGMMNGPWVLLAPIGFTVTVVLIGVLFDPVAAVAGLVLLILVLGTSFSLAKRIGRARRDLLPVTEERLRVTSEALQGIRVTKFYAWDESVATRVEKIRREEVKRYRRFHFLQILNSALLFLTSTFLAGVTIGVYVVYHGSFSVIQAFTLIAVINVSRQGVNAFPLGITDLSQSAVACHRIDEFLDSNELKSDDVENTTAESTASGSISVENAQFCWSAASISSRSDKAESFTCDMEATKDFSLEDVNLHIEAGSLVMVVGTVGSGKSSLLQALLGEMKMTGGHVDISGEIAYVSQEAWIRNATLRDNIVFEGDFDSERYEKVLAASQLSLDLAALPSGDRTEIGERGINLSGGQKARVSVARALYRESADILLLDDPLSAVDPHVANAIFEQCILGLAKHKTRVLVVNSHYDLLVHADQIVAIQSGRIACEGNYAETVARFPELASKSTVREDFDAVNEDKQQVSTSKQEHQTDYSSPVDATDAKAEDQLVEQEDRVKGRVTGYIYKTYLDETGFGAFTVVVIVIAGYSVSQGLLVLVNWWQAYWADNMHHPNASYSASWFGLWYFGFIAFGAVATVCRSVSVMLLLLRSSKNLHDELFRRVLAAPVNTYFDVTPVGRILNRFSNDLDQMDSLLPQQWQNFVQNISLSVGGFIVCALASYWIGLSYIPVIAALVVTGFYFKKTSREVKRLEGISRSPVYNLLGETLNGVQTIRAFKMQSTFEQMNANAVDENASFFFVYWAAGRWLAVRLDTLSVEVIFVVSLYLVATKGQLGTLLSGISLVYALMLTSMVQSSVRDVDRTDNAMTSVERILHFREIPQEEDSPDALPVNVTLWPSRGAIKFDNLQLKYRPELPLVLRGVNMSVVGGENVGICGRTGAGKSSLMIALFRICEFEKGTISIDGVDIQKVKLHDLRRSLAIIPQDPVLFSGSLRDNLDPFGEYSDAEIWTVLKQVHLAQVVSAWGSGLRFILSEKGDNLSVGQRQLLCIGRALLKNSKIVVLDEATANVDTATDALIQATIRQTFADKTVLIIAHRINTIMHCNKIAVMDAGRVVEFGPPAELLAQPESIFTSLAKPSKEKYLS
ncbi:Multidrug resistance-associated protein 1 [Phytophthora cactorum]|uniref:Multidrug resistance-associated protein 1 n=1 Tax=Phytophthora cactorum TaxID=29920 RepID=A0A329SGW0_9STRA|nr:Multidrug resistance-associated protein 1 [Phytophthora cactorum]KAG2828846.1 Multidrug resistance-associated protein 1 [Phytophthora cactorum]KAG2831685.1 Multidrug resistance-associated protein 1 [Phytophthora cactorum]KAG2859824.1 Multidrug resistance-associated protein 1 [Phytophthora cactorum]KAG2927244.1 Multidrug resistance-associated protein 1 [Phytophthora cactorum]